MRIVAFKNVPAGVWRGGLLFLGGSIGLAILYRDAWRYWHRLLTSDAEESIGLLVPLVVGFLIWTRREQLRATPARPSLLGGVAFAGAVAATAAAEALWFSSGIRFGLYCAIVALVWTSWGTAWLRVLAVPLIFLFFAQPLPVTLSVAVTHPLRLAVTEHAAWVLSLAGLASVAEGVLLHMPRATLETTDACSGLRGFVAALALAVLVADVIRGPRLTTALLFPGALLVAYALNVVRVVVEGLWTSATGAPSSSALHATFGFVTFAGVAALLVLWQMKTSERFA